MNYRDSIEHNRILFGISKAHKVLKHFNGNVELGSRKTINNLLTWKYESAESSEKVLKNISADDEEPSNEN